MRFKTDENIHPEVAEYLQKQGHDALTVWDQRLNGRDDPTIAGVCQSEGRALITLDVGFADIRAYPPDQHSGRVVLRLRSQSRASVIAVIHRLLPLLDREPRWRADCGL